MNISSARFGQAYRMVVANDQKQAAAMARDLQNRLVANQVPARAVMFYDDGSYWVLSGREHQKYNRLEAVFEVLEARFQKFQAQAEKAIQGLRLTSGVGLYGANPVGQWSFRARQVLRREYERTAIQVFTNAKGSLDFDEVNADELKAALKRV